MYAIRSYYGLVSGLVFGGQRPDGKIVHPHHLVAVFSKPFPVAFPDRIKRQLPSHYADQGQTEISGQIADNRNIRQTVKTDQKIIRMDKQDMKKTHCIV